MTTNTLCELCCNQASVHCPSDSAFLCWDCDAKVHAANFLVARHVRHPLCSVSQTLCTHNQEDGSGSDDDSSSCAFSSSACVSEDHSHKLRKRRRSEEQLEAKAEGIFVNWSRKLGVEGNAVVSPASHALVFCMTVSPLRVALAASFWFGLKMCGSTWKEQLSRVEAISGVPAKQMLAAESKLARALRLGRAPHDLKEGWDECSV